MATHEEQTNLVVNIVRDLQDQSVAFTSTAMDALQVLAAEAAEFNLNPVDVDIGAEANIAWTATLGEITPPTEPDWIDTAIAQLPETAPTIPDVSYTPPTLDESPPGALTGSVGTPGSLSLDEVTVPTLGTVPTIEAVTPTISLAALDTEFSFTEPTYEGELTTELKAALLEVIGGAPVLDDAYWNARLANLQSDISEEHVGVLRRASNAGAASWLPLPSEGRLAQTSAAQDAASKALQKARIELFIERSRQAREDFWNAVQQGLALEGQWIQYHTGVAQRALAAAEQLANVAINAHNANIGYYNLLIEKAKIDLGIDQAEVSAFLDAFRIELEGTAQKLSKVKTDIEAHQAEWGATIGAFNADTQRGAQGIQRFGEIVRAYGIEVDAGIKAAEFPLKAAEIKAGVYATQYGLVQSVANATKAIMDSRVATQGLVLEAGKTELTFDQAKNAIELELAKLAQAAQQAQATIEIAQSQWMLGQGADLKKNIAQLATGIAQSAIAAADVNLSSSAGLSKGAGINFSYSGDAASDRDPAFTV